MISTAVLRRSREPRTSKERRCLRAAVAIYLVALLHVAHMAYGVATNPDGKPFEPVAVVFGGAVQLVLFGLLVWLGLGVRRGRRFGGAIGVLAYLGCSWILIAGALLLTGDYPAPADLMVIQGALVVFIFLALALTILAATGVEDGRA